jgi:hypothetical protein
LLGDFHIFGERVQFVNCRGGSALTIRARWGEKEEGNVASPRKNFVILRGMTEPKGLLRVRKQGLVAGLFVSSVVLFAAWFYAYGQDKSDFPDGYDAVQAAPNSHKVVFENAFVRVLEVSVPPPGTTIPMHHHHWPSFFLDWDTGGATPHIRYHRPDGTMRDIPAAERPVHPGAWSVRWMEPEPMHAIEVVEKPKNAPTAPEGPSSLRIEIKCHP